MNAGTDHLDVDLGEAGPATDELQPVRVGLRDLVAVALASHRGRPLRVVLSSVGVAIGTAALVAVTGVAASNTAHHLAELDRMGANLLTVSPGSDVQDQPVALPDTAPEMIDRIGPVTATAVVRAAPDGARAYRTDRVPSHLGSGLLVRAASPGLPEALDTPLAWGRWFDDASRRLPTATLGARSAETLGVRGPGQRIWVADRWHVVIGVLEPVPLAAELDHTVFLGDGWAAALASDAVAVGASDVTSLGLAAGAAGSGPDDPPLGEVVAVHVATHPGTAAVVREVLARTASPAAPQHVSVSALSDHAAARELAEDSLTTLAAALAAIALTIGGVGIANTMVVAVVERRGEIGLRLALGARRVHVAAQFVVEALVLSVLGGAVGAGLGVVATVGYAAVEQQPVALAFGPLVAAPGLAVLVGAVAGVYPAVRAARSSPDEALRSA